MKKILALLLPITAFASCPVTEVACPSYCGGFYGGGAWVYLQPTSSDGDLEQGTFLTLTGDPANLNAKLLEIEPSYQNGFDLNIGYHVPCSNQSLNFDYLYLTANGSNTKKTDEIEEFIQNFLGASYTDSWAWSRQKIHQFDLTYGLDFVIDCSVDLHPFVGVGFADIQRRLKVFYLDEIFYSTPSDLSGKEKSKYWGVGPVFGTDFALPLFRHLKLSGHFETGFLFGKTKSQVDSESFLEDNLTTFFAKDSDNRVVTMLNTEISLVFTQPVYYDQYQLEIEVGYRADYYFKPINRIDPFNGYVFNSNTFPVNTPSNLGFHGPFIMVTIAQGLPCLSDPFLCNILTGCADSGLYFHYESTWLKPHPSKDDLTYGFINQKELDVKPSTTRTDTYVGGVQFCSSYDIEGRYFHLDTSDSDTTRAEGILSFDASGPAFVLFSEASSKAKYEINQIDGTVGKRMQLFCPFYLRGLVGLRYLDLKRKLDNVYLGGEPPLATREKFPELKSRFCGIGPIFGLEPSYNIFWDLNLVGRVDTALVIGEIKSTLDQNNIGVLGASSNTLRTPDTNSIVPVLDARGGLAYDGCFSCVTLHLEGGYQYTSYYRGINLVFPTFLTGLEQNNSNLKLTGPYLDVGLSICF